MRALRSLLTDDGGVALPEYALVLALLSLVAIAALAAMAVAASGAFNEGTNGMQSYNTGTPPP
jgi:Flp pilus assembly pilin Flp